MEDYTSWSLSGLAVLLLFLLGFLVSTLGRNGLEPSETICPPGAIGGNRGAMVIVEPRAHPDLRRVLQNFDLLGPAGYNIIIFHGKSHRQHAMRAAAGLSRQVTLHALSVDNLGPDEYSALLKSASFWKRVLHENILVFQTDTALCGASPHKVQEFEDLGYAGAAYDSTGIGRGSHWGADAFYGVGGLSFRKRSAMLECIAATPDIGQPEDVFFSNCVDSRVDKPRDAAQLSAFCTQSSFSQPSLGAHKTSLLHERHKEAFLSYCPEAAFMTSMTS